MTVDLLTFLAIVGMAAVTYGTRIAGLFIADRITLSARSQAAFEAIPAAVLIAVIAPMILATGPAETVAALATAVAATRLPLVGTIVVGVAAVVLLRSMLG